MGQIERECSIFAKILAITWALRCYYCCLHILLTGSRRAVNVFLNGLTKTFHLTFVDVLFDDAELENDDVTF